MADIGEEKDFYVVRLMKSEDIDKCLLLWRTLEFFEDRKTLVCAHTLNPKGFFIAEHKETGESITNGQFI